MICRRCLCDRDAGEFYELRTGTRRRVCKPCMRSYNARYYRSNSKPGVRYVKPSPANTYSVPVEFKQFARARFALAIGDNRKSAKSTAGHSNGD